MDHRQNGPSYGRDERQRGGETDRNRRSELPGRDFQPGNYGFEEAQYGSGQSGGFGPRERWGGERDYYGQGQDRERWGEDRASRSSGYYPPGSEGMTGYGGTQGGYGSSFYGQPGESQRYGDRDRWGGERWRGEHHRDEPQREYYGQVQQGGSFFGGNRPGEPGERQGFFKRIFKRGPKGYQRSDERLREDISERLMYAMHIDPSEVTVTVADGKVTLDGTVPERHMKHAIEDLVDECPGVQDIDNRVRVQREDFSRGSGGEEGSATTASRAASGAGNTPGSRKS